MARLRRRKPQAAANSALVDLISSDSDEFSADDLMRKRVKKDHERPSKRIKSVPAFSFGPAQPKRAKTPPPALKSATGIEPEELKELGSLSIGSENSPNPQSMSFLEKYEPRNTRDIAIHSRKLADVKRAMNAKPRLLILSGPAGCSKSTTARLVAKESGLDVIEWRNPVRDESLLTGISIVEAFDEFLLGIVMRRNNDRLAVLVEELPNVSHLATKQEFIKSLMKWVNYDLSVPMIILSITEVEMENAADSLVVERLLPRELLSHPCVQRVKFLPVNVSLITKTLRSIVVKEKAAFAKLPRREIEETIKALASSGDVRCAISSLEFWSRYHGTFLLQSRDSHFHLFHAAGRIVYGSKKDDRGEHYESNENVTQSIIDDWPDSQVLKLSVLENYTIRNIDIETASECSELLSAADTLPYPINDEVALRGVRTIMHCANIGHGYKQMRFPRDRAAIRSANERQLEIANYIAYKTHLNAIANGSCLGMTRTNAMLYDGGFEHLTAPNDSIKLWPRRVGGPIKSQTSVTATAEIEPDEESKIVFPTIDEGLAQSRSRTPGADDSLVEEIEFSNSDSDDDFDF
ncbi:hypothetical protein TRVA0_007S00782 [Trichomonascus vanleenenianus]|uniref:Rad24p n=1 Tax=Trichomonascus vanleenenianus TaxID=2268995 RepID=UPI003ECB80D7